MAILPARPAPAPFTLDTLVSRAQAVRSAPRRAAAASRPAPRPLAALERDSSIAERPPVAAPIPPTALALWITIRRCACGSVTRCPPDYALVKYDTNTHSVHYSRADTLAISADLPRELREKEVVIPFCEACFK